MATDNKAAILRAASPKLPAPRKPPAAPVPMGGGKTGTFATATTTVTPATVVAPAPAPVVDPDQVTIDETAATQHAHIVENLRRAKIARAVQAAVEAKLKADGISLDNINAEHLAQQHLADLETQTAEKAAREKAKELFKAKYGVEFSS